MVHDLKVSSGMETDSYSLSPMQQGMLYHGVAGVAGGARGVDVEQVVCELREEVSVAHFRQAWRELINRHEILRTSFHWNSSAEPCQVVHPAGDVTLEVACEEHASPGQARIALEAHLADARRDGFDVEVAPLLRVALFKGSPGRYWYAATFHHLLLDARGMGIIFRELSEIHDALKGGEPLRLPPVGLYRDYIAWLQTQDAKAAEQYWRERLRGFSAPTPVTLLPPGAPALADGPPYSELATRLSGRAMAKLRAVSEEQKITVNNFLQAAWALVLSRYAGEEDVLFGAVRACRRIPVEGVDGIAGVFINTVPLRTRVDSSQIVAVWLRELRQQWVDLRAYEHTPLVKIQQWSDVPPGRGLFDTLLNYQEPSWDGALANLGGPWRNRCFEVRAQPNYPLAIDASGDAALTIKLVFERSRFPAAAVAGMLGHYRAVLEAMVENVAASVGALSLLGDFERQQVLVDWNRTERAFSAQPLVHTQVEEQAMNSGDRLAVADCATELSYRELNERANQLAHRLAEHGVGAESVVAVCMDRSVEMIIAWLAVLKAGGAFLPLDPANPKERLAFQLEDSGAVVLLTQPHLRGVLPVLPPALSALDVHADGRGFKSESPRNPSRPVSPGTLAYVIYTSGSTGQPKGVQIEHAALLNLVTWHRSEYAITPRDRASQLASPAFDASVWEIWPYLTTGAAIYIPDAEIRQTPERLVGWLADKAITIAFLPTPLAEAAMEEAWPKAMALRTLLTGGDRLRRSPPENLPCVLFNHYGPTENTVVTTSCAIASGMDGTVPAIGRPIANTRVYVLDTGMQPAPVGVVGELYIGGDSLARGYLNRPELTAEKFVRDPFLTRDTAGRLYRTGDLVRWRSNGELEFVGRLDGQVKIRGHRIELGEIETALQRHPAVRESIVLARPDGCGQLQLVAYVLPRSNATVDAVELDRFLRKSLPSYMIAAAFVRVESWPLTSNGKIDRRALPAPGLNPAPSRRVPPRTPAEQALAQIWMEVLGCPPIGRDDNFFALGGHSLLAARVVSRLNAARGTTLSVRSLFDHPTLAALAGEIEVPAQGPAVASAETSTAEVGIHARSWNSPDSTEAMEPTRLSSTAEPVRSNSLRADAAPTNPSAPVERPIPASSGQRRLWFLEQMEPGSPLYNIPYMVRLSGVLNEQALERALQTMVTRHEALRTNFVAVGSEPIQVVAETWQLEVPLTDLSRVEHNRREAELTRLAQQDAREPFDLARGLMLRARLYRLAPTEHALMLVMHHIASDGWSMAVLYREIGVCYEAFSRGLEPRLPTLPVQYADFADWQQEYLRGETLQRLVDYWKKQMAGAPALLELPTDHPRPPLQSHRGDTTNLCLSAELVARLKLLGSQQRVTFFMTLLAGLNAVIHRYSGQTDLVIGTPLAGRDSAETESLVGFFINNVLMRTDLSGDPSVKDLLMRVRDVALTAFEYRQMPYEKLVEELQPQRNLSFDPLCQVFFALQNMPTAPLKLSGMKLSIAPVYTGTAKADLTLWGIEEEDGSLSITAEYALDLFTGETMERLLGHLRTVLEAMVANPEQRLSALPLLSAPEKRQMLEEWNATQQNYPRNRCVHQLFEDQVARSPDAVAVVFDDESLTYAELNARAELLAQQLRKQGVGPDVLVAICVERSLEMMIGLIGIHKAGGAYVPLDPTYPKERIAFMLQDSQAPVLITQLGLLPKLPPPSAAVICLDAPAPVNGFHPEAAEVAEQPSADHLAYVLYTSGSTGNPKGVMVTHRNVVNFFAGMDAVLGTDPGVWLAVTSISFDISVLELFWTLTRGFKVVILSDAAKVPGLAEAKQALAPRKTLDFSLFYFASEDESTNHDRYRLLLEGAKFADQHGFKAVWTPERHFHSFGGLYPNPAVVGAAIAAVTQRVQIRAGSVVTPLHHPARVAEEWSVVDNLSNGRVGISVANGWHDRDFALQPQNYAQRREQMRKDIGTIRQLWRGEAVEFTGGRGNQVPVRIYPRPIQSELPMWITAAGSPETFKLAGEMGAGVLTHLLGQDLDELAKKIVIYREARRAAGHSGEGCVSIALHTFVGVELEAVKAKVKEPMIRYLADSADLMKGLSQAMYPGCEMKNLTKEETRGLVEFSFNRYFEVCGLLGTPSTCRQILQKLAKLGIDEVACLIDFGVDTVSTLESLKLLDQVRAEFQQGAQTGATAAPRRSASLADQVERHGVTHLQCTPSFARLLMQSPETRRALKPLRKLLVGGEALPAGLADQLVGEVAGSVINMYGPTETTIWSTTALVGTEPHSTGVSSIGRPIANTQVYILDAGRQPAPIGVPGELWIGGEGVARGYWRRPDLTRERFVADPFVPGNRLYRTGDLARFRSDGVIEFLGRVDQQVKIRGHRIELGEIEAALMQHSEVRQAVVVLRTDNPEDPQLAAYFTPAGEEAPEANTLRAFLKQKLPEHMIPSLYLKLERLPLTPNGKVDRKALPAPQGNELKSTTEFVAPQGGVEQAVAAIWKEILRVEQLGVDDNFFDFGGHSLQVVQVQNRLRETLGVDVPVLKLFQYPTIRALGRFIDEQQTTAGVDPFRQKIEERTRRRQGMIPRRRPALAEERP